MCRRWSDESEDSEHRIRVRAHVNTDSSNNGKLLIAPDEGNPGNSMSLATGNHANDWTSAWGSATDSPQHLTGLAVDMTTTGVAVKMTSALIRFRKDTGSPEINSIEIGAPYDLDYDFDDDEGAEEYSTSGATRMYLDYDAASSWMMSNILGHTLNCIDHGATWRMSFPVCGSRS